MTSSSLYPINYLSEFFVPYDSSSETSILLISMSSILNTFVDFFVFKIYALSTHSYTL